MSKKWPQNENLEPFRYHLYALDIMTARWNEAEQYFQCIIWRYVGYPQNKGQAVTHKMNGDRLVLLLRRFANGVESNNKMGEELNFADDRDFGHPHHQQHPDPGPHIHGFHKF